ncbi:hypothetical protein JHK86_027766 [Glycine max]|nr:hypothetical protein JHK86_027766 [Glycine max]
MGTAKTLAHDAENFIWPAMRQDVKLFITTCLVCQQTKNDHQRSQGLLCSLPILARPWVDLSLDFIVGLPPFKGHSTLFVVVDRFLKGIHIGLLPPHYTAFEVAKVFMEISGKIHGILRSLVSDRDPLFVSRFWQELFKLSGTTLRMSTAYHPQTDGQTEVMNRVIEQYLRAFVHHRPSTWGHFLLWAEWSYNTSTHSATGMSPYEVTFGKKPPNIPQYLVGDSRVEAMDTWLTIRDTMLQSLMKKLQKPQQRMKDIADKKRRDVDFAEGDSILVKLRPHRQSSVSGGAYTKLTKRFYGPFKVLQKIGLVAYKLDLPPSSKIHPVFHCSLLRPYQPRSPSHQTLATLPASAEDNYPLITPLTILDTKWQNFGDEQQLMVLVQWAGLLLEDTTWEPWANLKETYNLEGKLAFDEGGNVTIKDPTQGNTEHGEQEIGLNTETTQEAEFKLETGTSKEKASRPKREIVKP